MPLLPAHITLELRDVQAYNRALRTLPTMSISDVMESDLDKLSFVSEDSALEDLFETFQLTDHLWVTRDTKRDEVVGLLTFHDVRRLIVPVKHTYSSMSRRDLNSLDHRTAGCVGCLVEKAVLWSISPKQTVTDALELMEAHDLSYLAVVDGNTFLGEVSVRRLVSEANRIISILGNTSNQ
jgi:CBS domain-containing protein